METCYGSKARNSSKILSIHDQLMTEDYLTKMQRHLTRQLFAKPPYAPHINLAGKQYIVTGASPNSIGFATAKTLLQWGATVVITTRSKPEEAAKALRTQTRITTDTIYSHELDLTKAKSVTEFAKWYKETRGELLDGLINNAGIHLDLLSQWKEPRLTNDKFEIHWRTNYLGTAHLNHLLLPLLIETGKKNGDARLINVVSHLHTKGSNSQLFAQTETYNSWSAYGLSKLALVHNAFEIQRRYARESNLQAFALHPGSIATNISDKGLEGTGIVQKMRRYLAPLEAKLLLTPEQGAQTQIFCATQPHLQGGTYYDRCQPGNVGDDANDAVIATRLWEETEKWIEGI